MKPPPSLMVCTLGLALPALLANSGKIPPFLWRFATHALTLWLSWPHLLQGNLPWLLFFLNLSFLPLKLSFLFLKLSLLLLKSLTLLSLLKFLLFWKFLDFAPPHCCLLYWFLLSITCFTLCLESFSLWVLIWESEFYLVIAYFLTDS